jgi:small-conductance mechanosensitive channel
MEVFQDIQKQVLSYYDLLIAAIPKVGIGFIVSIIAYVVLNFLRTKIIGLVRTKAHDKLLANFFDSVSRILVTIICILIFLYIIGQAAIAGTILGAATVSSFVIGFAFKDIAENFLAGVIMAFSRPFNVGDTVKTGEVEGKIMGLSLRETHIKTYDGKDVFVPNGQIIKSPLYNFTIDGYLRKSFMIGLDYGTDIEKARSIIIEVLQNTEGVLNDNKKPQTFIKEFGASTINIEVQIWVNTFASSLSSTEVQSQAMRGVLNRLEEEGVNLPGDVIELKNYKDRPLSTGSSIKEM